MNEALILLLAGVIILQLRNNIKLRRLMADIADLRTKITETGGKVDAAAQRVIDHLPGVIDFAPEVEQLNAIGQKADTISPNP